jgi:hypothetical protein
MATITTRTRPFDLREAHRRVRHPLDRLAGYIRLYVALEGVALLFTFLAVWFWFSLVMDYGFFKVFGLDWVQESPRWARAMALGTFFALVVALLQFPTLLPAVGRELSGGLHEAFSPTPRQLVPFWVRLVVGVLAIAGVGLLAWLIGDGGTGAGLYVGFIVASVFIIALVSLLYLQSGPGLAAAAAKLPALMWVRAGLGLIGLVLGCIFGGMIATGLFGDSVVAATAGAAVGAALLGALLWHFGSMVYMLVTQQQYRVLLGVPVLSLYVLAWVLVGMAAEDEAGPAITAVFICLLLLGPAAFLAAKRLFHDFHPRALALVLERRFPQILGDRLITAVELDDPQATTQFGYSPAMVEETIHEAAQRVEKLPLGEVFDWRRLARQGLTVLIVTLGGYLVAGGAFALSDAIVGNESGLGSFTRFHDVSAIWAERNLLLENTIWPRRAHLEFLDQFAGIDEFKVGRDNAAPTVKVRALKWVIADRDAPEGWRLMFWSDLNQDLLGEPVPDVAVPAEWAVRDPERGPSLDEIELRLDKPETQKSINPNTDIALRDLLATLEQRSKLASMSRRFRMLTLPSTVYVNYWGGNTRSEMTLKQINDNEYEGQFPDLKETVTFRARGEDYYTANKKIIVVPPPSLIHLTRDQYEPAYLYYRGKPDVLRGRKQVRRNLDVSLFGGDVSRIELPAGSDIVLTATTDKELQPDGVRVLSPEDKKPLPGVNVEVAPNSEGLYKIITTRFNNVRSEIKFFFEFVDTDNVVGRRQVAIRPQEDLPPEVEVQVEVMRKTPQGYMVTPLAQIPFSGIVRDDRGLESIEFLYTLTRTEAGDLGGKPLLMVSAMQMMAGGLGNELVTAACFATLARTPKTEGDNKGNATLGAFAEKLVRRPGEILPMDEVLKLLDEDLTGKNAQRSLLKDFKFDPDDPELYFDLDPNLAAQRYPGRAKLPTSLKASEGQRQPRYRLQLWMEATDTDIVTGPHRGQSKERFNFIIVPEEELLGEVAKEEENHHVKLDQAVSRLREGESKLTTMKLDLATEGGVKQKDVFGNMSLRTEEIEQTLEKTLTTVTEVHADYQRILQELILNRIQTINYIKNIEDNIVGKLREAIDADYPDAEKAMKELHRVLDADEANLLKKTTDARTANDEAAKQLAKLIKKLDDVLASMEKLTNINKLIAMLLKIQDELGTEELRYQDNLKKLKDDLFKELEATEPGKKPEKKK